MEIILDNVLTGSGLYTEQCKPMKDLVLPTGAHLLLRQENFQMWVTLLATGDCLEKDLRNSCVHK